MTRGTKVLVLIILVAGAFLSGLLIGYLEVRETRKSLQTAQNERDNLRLQKQLSQIRDLAALMYVETSRQNYGLGGEYAARYFEQVKRLENAELPAAMRDSIRELLSHQDAVTASLSRAEPGATQQVQALFLDTYHRTQLEETDRATSQPR
ncbi:MAG: hypothetical protein ACE15E_09715 [Acidobacteriota bacterium]